MVGTGDVFVTMPFIPRKSQKPFGLADGGDPQRWSSTQPQTVSRKSLSAEMTMGTLEKAGLENASYDRSQKPFG